MREKIENIFVGVIAIFMLLSTVSSALAIDETNNLNAYPDQFITNGIFTGAVVVGDNALASDTVGQATILANLQTKAVSIETTTETNEIEVIGGTKEIKLGEKVNTEFDSNLDDSDLDQLQDKQIKFNNEDYDVHDELILGEISLETSLTSDIDYEDSVALEAEKKSIKYKYIFDDSINLNDVDSDTPLTIDFLGRELKITSVDNEEMTINFGSKYVLEEEDELDIDGKTLKVTQVGDTSIVINVDGITEIVGNGESETINGVEIEVNDIVYDGDSDTKDIVSLYAGNDVKDTINDGDDYFNNEEWTWDFSTIDDTDAKHSFGIELNENYNDDNDEDLVKDTGCYDLPDKFLSICLTGLKNDEYSTFEIEYDDNYEFDDVDGYADGDVKAFVFKSDNEDGFTIKEEKTNELVFYVNGTNGIDVFYKDDEGDLYLANDYTISNTTNSSFAKITYEDNEIDMDLTLKDLSLGNPVNITIDAGNNKNLEIILGKDTSEFKYLGTTVEAEDNELIYGGTEIGEKDNDLMTKYGIIIKDPDSNGDDGKVIMEIPSEEIEAVVKIGGTTTVETTESTISVSKVNPIPSSAIALSSEITNPTAQNLIVIGGPAVNPLASTVFGMATSDFTPNEAMIKVINNGDFMAILIAGYGAVDTRNAALAVAKGELNGINKAEAKVISTTQAIGAYVVE
ncbi:hypothetical protein CMI37_32530 [Candidatus Pacearchaeota archaeon]|nr:hypothetical protein [Candidatus Pacearchaeota archaeon]|tara:strand:+ start:23576 stop:25630 length:2055 start_codon:yes stop_codon:yes gene_type:complete